MARNTADGFSVTLARRTCGAVLVATVSGTVDLATAPAFDARMHDILELGNFRRLVIDLRPVTFLAAAGVRCLIRTQQASQQRGIDLRIVVGDSIIKKVLESFRDEGLPIPAPSVDAACQIDSEQLPNRRAGRDCG